jgi:hypothetical protein
MVIVKGHSDWTPSFSNPEHLPCSFIYQIDWDAREDDEISITLRSLQKELREVMKVNKARKQRLLGLVNNHLAYQEYNTILDDLDKQVEQGYLKRFVSQMRCRSCNLTDVHATAIVIHHSQSFPFSFAWLINVLAYD